MPLTSTLALQSGIGKTMNFSGFAGSISKRIAPTPSAPAAAASRASSPIACSRLMRTSGARPSR